MDQQLIIFYGTKDQMDSFRELMRVQARIFSSEHLAPTEKGIGVLQVVTTGMDVIEELLEVTFPDQEYGWRFGHGSNLGEPDFRIKIKGKYFRAWRENHSPGREYDNLQEYLCDAIGASNGKNTDACLRDLAKFNNLPLWELIGKYY